MNAKQRFMESLGWSEKWAWFDSEGVLHIGEGRIAIVKPTTKTMSKHGRIASKTFWFSDYLEPAEVQPHPNAHLQKELMVIGNTGWDWYILEPADTTRLTSAIEQWIGMFK